MYQVWNYGGEFLVLGSWGLLLVLVRRVLFGKLCRDAALGSGSKRKMLRAMTLKFEKSTELRMGIEDRQVFVRKYLYQEKRFGVRLGRWRRLPERWTGLILCVGFLEAVVWRYLGFDTEFMIDHLLAAFTAAVVVWLGILIWESDSLWNRAEILLSDYVSNTLYPRQVHIYETFEEEQTEKPEEPQTRKSDAENTGPKKEKLQLKKEEEQIFQEVLSEFLGSST